MVYTITDCAEVTSDKGTPWRQLVISFVASLPFFTHGVLTTILTTSPHTGHFIVYDHVPWTTTLLVLLAAVSAPLWCYTINQSGRQVGVFIVSFLQGASLIPLFLVHDTSFFVLHGLAGLSSGALFTVLPIYIREISSATIRGYCMMLMTLMTSSGYMMRLVMNAEERRYLVAATVACQVLFLMLIVESPSYLVMKGKLEAAQKKIAKLRGLPDDNVYVASHLAELKNESERAKNSGGLSVITLYRNKIWWDTLKMALGLNTLMVLCGNILFLDQEKVLIQLKAEPDPHSMMVLSTMMAGGAIAFCASFCLDRKHILILSFFLMGVASGILGVFTQVDLTITKQPWLPVYSLVVIVFGYGMSWALPIIITVEIFSFEIRATMVGVVVAYSQLLKMAHIHSLQYIEERVGVYTMMYIFAGINLFGIVYTLFDVPNIRHKNFRQIEKQIKRIPLPA